MVAIPVIDVSKSNPDAARQLLAAATDSGFAFIKANEATGLKSADIDAMFELSKQFFAEPDSVKAECTINSAQSGANRGWSAMHHEKLDPAKQKRGDFKEAFNYSLQDPPQLLTGPLDPARNQLKVFQERCHALCLHIMALFGEALGTQPSEWFVERHDATLGETGSILRLLFYPAVEMPDDEVDIRAGAHSDYGSVTLLFQRRGQPGLEIWSPEEKWESVPVDPIGDGGALPILLNIGDVLSYWTNGLLKSTIHRVVFPRADAFRQTDRYSMAYFCHPLDAAQLTAVPSALVASRSGSADAKRQLDKVKGLSGGTVLTSREHLNARLAATYDLKA